MGMLALVMIDGSSGMRSSSLVPRKGVRPSSVVRVSNGLRLLGHIKIALKSDNEPALRASKDVVQNEL